MKSKNVFYTNFKFNSDNKNNLKIDKVYNLNNENENICSEITYQNVLLNLFDADIVNQISSLNEDVITQAIQYIPYIYFDETTHAYINRLLLLTKNYVLYELNYDDMIFELKYSFTLEPQIIHQDNNIYFFDVENKCIIINSSTSLQIENIPKIISYTNTTTKTFFTLNDYPNTVFECDLTSLNNINSNITQYTKYTLNTEDGEVIKICKIKNKVYVVSTYSILQINEEFNQLTHFTSNQLMIYNASEHFDNNIILHTSNGLYFFNGNDFNSLNIKLPNYSKNANLISFNQNLYIFNGNLSNLIFKYNLSNEYYTELKLDNIINIYIIKTNKNYNLCACICENEEYKNITLYNQNQSDTFNQEIAFMPTTFNSLNNKIIKRILLNASGIFNFSIKSNLSETTFVINGNTQLNNVFLEGTIFYFKINSESIFNLQSIFLSYDEEDS